MATLLGAHQPQAAASPYSEVASALDKDDPFDLTMSLSYGFDVHSAAVKREFAGFPGTDPNAPLPLVKDLVFKSSRHTVVPKLQLGIFTDMSLTLALPIVITDKRNLEFDQRDTPCSFGADATCIDATNSSTIASGLLPARGFDSNDPGGPGFATDSAMIFRGPTRKGIDQIHLGAVWAPMNQARDDTKPTWKIGAEARIAVGKVMKFDRANPSGSDGVGRGLHEVRLWTSMAKRIGWAEPYMEAWWQAPFGKKGGSQFIEPGFGQRQVQAQQRAGTRFGFEAIIWEKKGEEQLVALDFSARLEARFEGRDYSEMWEVFQYAGDASVAAADRGPLVLDSDPTNANPDLLSHPGVSNLENYLRFGGRFGVNAVLGPKVRFGLNFEMVRNQSHLISFADAGVDKPTCSGGAQPPSCEISSNDVVDPGTDEVNPLHVSLIDTVGGRYRADESLDYVLTVNARILF